MQVADNRTIKPVKFKTRVELLDQEQVKAIDQASREILEKIGVKMPLPAALDLLEEAGAKVDRQHQLVFFPPDLVGQILDRAQGSFTLCARNPFFDLPLDGDHGYLTLDGCGLQVLDLQDGRLRKSCLRDLEEAVRVADYLELADYQCPGLPKVTAAFV